MAKSTCIWALALLIWAGCGKAPLPEPIPWEGYTDTMDVDSFLAKSGYNFVMYAKDMVAVNGGQRPSRKLAEAYEAVYGAPRIGHYIRINEYDSVTKRYGGVACIGPATGTDVTYSVADSTFSFIEANKGNTPNVRLDTWKVGGNLVYFESDPFGIYPDPIIVGYTTYPGNIGAVPIYENETTVWVDAWNETNPNKFPNNPYDVIGWKAKGKAIH